MMCPYKWIMSLSIEWHNAIISEYILHWLCIILIILLYIETNHRKLYTKTIICYNIY